jgi:hypothetical protein
MRKVVNAPGEWKENTIRTAQKGKSLQILTLREKRAVEEDLGGSFFFLFAKKSESFN